ncbi:DUF262 domain-containing protein [Actinosynnema sp. NPDC051121]
MGTTLFEPESRKETVGDMSTGSMLNRSGSDSYSITQVVSLAESGYLRVPSFQRSFVWGSSDVRALFDSLYRGFPVGTLLLWQRYGPPGDISFGPLTLDVAERTDALWVVDGQQRVTSLLGSLSRRFEGVDERFEVYFDLASERFINPRRGVVPPRSMPVRDALETKSLLNWLRIHEEELEPRDFDVADRLGGVLREYKVPVYIVTDNDQNVLREVFDRVNSSGKPISRAQVFHALFANEEEPGSPASVVEAIAKLGFGRMAENRVVQSLLGIRGGDVQRDIHNEFSLNEAPIDWYDRTEEALVRSINFLRAEGVPHIDLMPNTLPLPVLATFFYVHPEPEPWILRLLARWLWRGWVHGFGKGGGQTPILRRSIRAIYPDKGKIENAPGQYAAVTSLLSYVPDREPEMESVSLDNFRTDRGESRIVLLAMAAQEPLDAEGERIDIARLFNDKGVSAVSEFVRGHRTTAAARGFWIPEQPYTAAVDSYVFKSHIISYNAWQSLLEGDVEHFLRLRSFDLSNEVLDFLSNRLETGAIVRPSINDLLVAGSEED